MVLVVRLDADITSGNQAQHSPAHRRRAAFAKLPLGNLRPDSSVTLLHDEEATINELMSSLGTDR